MLEKRSWSNIGIIILAFLTCLFIWRIFSNPVPSYAPLTTQTVFTLYTQNRTELSVYLPPKDYNRLIDLNFSFLILNYVCNETNPLLLVLVHSSPLNFAKRRTIRETWGQNNDNVKVLFVLGSVNSSDLQKTLAEENQLYNDFIQGNFLDTYRNITYKHVMVFKYVLYHCPQAKYVLKTDDDVFVNMPTMTNFLTFDLSPYGANNFLFCMPIKHSKVLRSYRSKWRVSFKEYPNRNYPTYCPGWTLLYSPDVILALYKEAQKTDYFWIDDIHITGTLTEKINLTHTNAESFVLSRRNLRYIVDYGYNVSQDFLFGRADLEEREIRALWRYALTHPVRRYIFRRVQDG